MKTILLLILFAGALNFGHAQTAAAPGTYQLMTTNVKAQEVFTTDILVTIESERKLDEINIIQVGDYTWARILSQNTIGAPGFIPLSDEIIEIDPSDDATLPHSSNN